ncbi:DUF4145 domain-containing protein [Pseudomonas syringae group genomosp. 3]|uniref:DUF4145 domain-containing protein n=1 Tax=Pseudomonas syringae group genomosp. 3 TaxID=251701 RepID=UPI0005C968ED|nr:DUF4145 domain-containing protein [Pseudomonas syringae group genomosp. 3]KPB98515.1 Uncharacterized protein AC506_4767 [Pseudomonas syringae pv. maculicola str. M6]KPX76511.1 Uncharacterized protein ALO84_03990 [Pseudomonas syringae pv. maculicola]
MQEAEHPPLMPQSAFDYYLDEQHTSRLYQKAGSIRNCLENLFRTVLVHLVDPKDAGAVRHADLVERIGLLKHFFPRNVIDSLHRIRKLGNDGAHEENHTKLSNERIRAGLRDLGLVCEWTILTYFKKRGLRSKAWVATLFSILPPVYRVRILKQLVAANTLDQAQVFAQQTITMEWNRRREQESASRFSQGLPFNDQLPEETEDEAKISNFLLIINKLAVALVKNQQFGEGCQFLYDMHEQGWITDANAGYMFRELQSLQVNLHQFPIATTLEEARQNLRKVLPLIAEEESALFTTLFSAIVLGRPEDLKVRKVRKVDGKSD